MRGADFPLVALLVLVDPDADRDLQAELGGDRRDQFDAAGRRIGADGAGVGRDQLQIGADLLARSDVAVVGMLRALRTARRKRWRAGRRNSALRLLPLEQSPQAGMHARHKRDHSSDGAHRSTTTRGRKQRARTRPLGSTNGRRNAAYLAERRSIK